MAKLQYKSISRRTVEALPVAKDTVFWDNELTGFGVRVYPSGARVYVVQSRGPGGLKRVTVGRHGVISADQARRRARQASTLIIEHANSARAAEERGAAVAGAITAELAIECDVRFVGRRALPRTSSGKISRAAAKAAYLEGRLAPC